MERVPGEECRGPVRVVVVQRAVVFLGSAKVPLKLGSGSLEAFNRVCEVFAIGAREVMRVEWGRELAGEEFDEPAVLFPFVGVMEHFAVVRGVVCSVLGSAGVVGAEEEGDFFGDEFPGGSQGEVAVVGWVVSQLVLVADNCLRVFVPTEGFVYGLFPWEGEVADVG